MSSIDIRKIGITKLDTDAIVNAANEGLWEGGGVCGYIFAEAGSAEMTKACQAIGGCKTGNAVITPGFKLPAKYVIHAVGPRWKDGEHNEPKLLYSTYKQSLMLAKENGLHSIGFPLISAGIFGYPVDKAWRKAIQACNDFLKVNTDYDIEIVFAVLDEEILTIGQDAMRQIQNEASDQLFESFFMDVPKEILTKAFEWCKKYEVLFKIVYEDKIIQDALHGILGSKEHSVIYDLLWECTRAAYDEGIVIKNYSQILSDYHMDKNMVEHPTETWVDGLAEEQILAVIAYHCRAADVCGNGWLKEPVVDGSMLRLVRAFLRKHKSE